MVIVDSSVWIDYIEARRNSHTEWLKRELPRQRVGLTDLVLCEILQGIGTDELAERVRHQLSAMYLFLGCHEQLAISAARNYRSLRGQGITVRKTIDCLIATFCIENGHSLLHRDRDFDAFEKHLGLKVIHP